MYNQIQEHIKRIKQLKKLRDGITFTKHGRRGKPHTRLLTINSTFEKLTWCDPSNRDKKKTIKVSEFSSVQDGCKTKVFERLSKKKRSEIENVCMSLVGSSRSLDMQFSTEQEKEEWYTAFKHLYEEIKDMKQMQQTRIYKIVDTLTKWNLDINSSKWNCSRVLSRKMSDEEASYISSAIDRNPILEEVRISDAQLSDNGARFIMKGVLTSKIKSICLSGNNISDEGAQLIATDLKSVLKNLKLLNLSSNPIGDTGAKAIAQALTKNDTLEELHLNKCSIGDEGAINLAESIAENKSLKILQLNDNQITAFGARALAKCCKSDSNKLERVQLARNKLDFSGGKEEKKDEEDGLEVKLFLAVDNRDYTEALLLMLDGADPNVQNDTDGRTPLHIAAISGDLAMLELLLCNPKIDKDAPDDRGTTPIFCALENRQYKAVNILIQNKANIRCYNQQKKSLLHLAAEQGHLKLVQDIIEKGGEHLNICDENDVTPLHLAAQNNHKEVVTYLLQRDEKIRKELIEKGVLEPESIVNWQDKKGETALHRVFNNGKIDIEMAKILVKAGADISKEDKNKKTAVHDCDDEIKNMLMHEARSFISSSSLM